MSTSNEKEVKRIAWVLEGLIWGFLMFLIMGLAMPYAEDGHLELQKTLKQAAVWLIGGLFYGFTMKLVRGYYDKTKE